MPFRLDQPFRPEPRKEVRGPRKLGQPYRDNETSAQRRQRLENVNTRFLKKPSMEEAHTLEPAPTDTQKPQAPKPADTQELGPKGILNTLREFDWREDTT